MWSIPPPPGGTNSRRRTRLLAALQSTPARTASKRCLPQRAQSTSRKRRESMLSRVTVSTDRPCPRCGSTAARTVSQRLRDKQHCVPSGLRTSKPENPHGPSRTDSRGRLPSLLALRMPRGDPARSRTTVLLTKPGSLCDLCTLCGRPVLRTVLRRMHNERQCASSTLRRLREEHAQDSTVRILRKRALPTMWAMPAAVSRKAANRWEGGRHIVRPGSSSQSARSCNG